MARIKLHSSGQSSSPRRRRRPAAESASSSSPSPSPIDNNLRSPTPPASVESSLKRRGSSHEASQEQQQRPKRVLSPTRIGAPADRSLPPPSPIDNTLRSPTPPLSAESSLKRRSHSREPSQQPSKRSNKRSKTSSPSEIATSDADIKTTIGLNAEAEASTAISERVSSPNSNSSSPSRKRSREVDDAAMKSDALAMPPSKRTKSPESNIQQEADKASVNGATGSIADRPALVVNATDPSSPDNSSDLKPNLKNIADGDKCHPGAAESAAQPPSKPKRGKAPARKAAPKKAAKGKPAPKKAAASKAVKLGETDDETPIDEAPNSTNPAASSPVEEEDVKPVATRTSGRSRAAPKRLNDETQTKPAPKQTKGAAASAAAPSKRSARNAWAPENLLTEPKSKLVQVNLVKLLKSDAAWEALSKEERLTLAAMLPNQPLPTEWPDDVEVPNVIGDHVNTSTFRTDLADWQNHLAAGYFKPAWLENAAQAMERRANGDFDDWKERERDAYWADAEYEEDDGDDDDDDDEAQSKKKGKAKLKAKGKGKKR